MGIAQTGEAILPLVRSVGLAHLLAPDPFGTAMALTAVAAIIESSADMGLDRLAVIAANEADADRRIATLHTISVLRGFAIGVVLAVLGVPIAYAVHAGPAWPAFCLLSAGSIIRGFSHLGVKQAMGRYSYWREGVTSFVWQSVWTVTSLGLAFRTADYNSMLLGIIAGQVASVAATHGLSRSPWRLGWIPRYGAEALRFSAPLMPNGLALVATTLVDRIVVAAVLGLAPMGIYYTAMMAATLPRGVVNRVMVNFTIPAFVNRQPSETRLFTLWAAAVVLVAFLFGAGYMATAQPVLPMIFGARFAPSSLLVVLIGFNVFLKFLEAIPVPPSLAAGATRFILRCTLSTTLALGTGTLVLLIWHAVSGFVLGLAVGQALAIAYILYESLKRFPFPRHVLLPLLAVAFAALCVMGFIVLDLQPTIGLTLASLAIALAVLSALTFLLCRPPRRHP